MGHDIFAIRTIDKKDGELSIKNDVAYLRRSIHCSDRSLIYKVLGAEKHDGGVSGLGTHQKFNRKQIEKALSLLDFNSDQFEFLKKCLKNLDDNDEIFIAFF